MEIKRLQKYMAQCGVASLRKSEEMIKAGVVTVNGEVVIEMGRKVNEKDDVRVAGKKIFPLSLAYYLLNKPRGCICSVKDEKGRCTVISLLPDELKALRIYPVGRLDYDTKGIILLTNDGILTQRLIGPKSNVEKEYLARVEGIVGKKTLTHLSQGVLVNGTYVTKKCKARILSFDKTNNSTLLSLVLTEGKNHEVKDMLKAVNHPVKKLSRIRIADLTLAGLPEGKYRPLKPHEIKKLYAK